MRTLALLTTGTAVLILGTSSIVHAQEPQPEPQPEPTVTFTDGPGGPGIGGGLGDDDPGQPGNPVPGVPSSEGPYEYTAVEIIDFFLDVPCPAGLVYASVEVWEVRGPPETRTFLYTDQECVDVPWWDQPGTPPIEVPALNGASAWAVIREQLPLPTFTADPQHGSLTGLEVFLWHAPDPSLALIDHDGDPTTPPRPGLTVTATEGPYTLSATVWIDRYGWDLGDGSTYTATEPGDPLHPAAIHVYRTKSPDYHVTATTVWIGVYDYATPTRSETGLPMGELTITSPPLPYPVAEVRAVPADPVSP